MTGQGNESEREGTQRRILGDGQQQQGRRGKEMGARTFRVGRGRDLDFIARAVGRQWSALSWVL